MKACEVFVLIFIAIVVPSPSSADGPCEKVENRNWAGSDLKTCYMESTVIDSKNFSITSDRDETVGALYAWHNYKLEHLPRNLGATFPNLIILQAADCSIREVTKDNFEGLSKLRYLYLQHSQIEKIDDDTFDGIPVVENIALSFNKIKRLNGRVFASLHKLKMVWLGGNACISEDFIGSSRIAEMPRIVTEKCAFIDSEPEAALMAQS